MGSPSAERYPMERSTTDSPSERFESCYRSDLVVMATPVDAGSLPLSVAALIIASEFRLVVPSNPRLRAIAS